MIVPDTQGAGLLGIGYLKSLPIVPSEFIPETNSKGNSVVSLATVQTYLLFFARYENTYIPAGDEKLYSFLVVRMLNPTSAIDCATQLGMKTTNVYGLTQSQYETGTFQHPVYLNQNNEPLTFNYTDVSVIIQTTPGRLDNSPIGAPNFPLTPNFIASQQGMLPQPPYPDFIISGGQTGGTAINTGGQVRFLDASLRVPTTVQPTSWRWGFGGTGACAGPTGVTAQNPLVTFGVTGSYAVTLTATNANGSSSITKNNFVIVS
jgi:PKD repeat protein